MGAAVQALGRLGNSASPTVLDALTDYATYRDDAGEHIVSVEAAQAVRQIDPKTAVPGKPWLLQCWPARLRNIIGICWQRRAAVLRPRFTLAAPGLCLPPHRTQHG